MILKKTNLANVKNSTFDMLKDVKKNGEQRFSWYTLRDAGMSTYFEHIYSFSENDMYRIDCTDNEVVVFAVNGEYSVKVTNDNGNVFSDSVCDELRNFIYVVPPAVTIELDKAYDGSSAIILSAKPIAGAEEMKAEFEKLADGIVKVKNTAADCQVKEIYNFPLFSENLIKSYFCITSCQRFRFKDTFRGMYVQTGPRPCDCLLRCISGSAEIYCIDLRRNSPTFKKSFSVKLNSADDAVYISAEFAVGIRAAEDETVVLSNYSSVHDIRLQRVINLKSCTEISESDRDSFILSLIDRNADELDDDADYWF